MSSEGRPTGVAILAILEAFVGVYYLITGFGEFVAAAVIRSLALSGITHDVMTMIPRVLGTMLMIVGLLSILLAWGIWTGKGWARMVALVFAIVAIILSLISLHFVGLVIDVIIVYYLTRPNVKQFFPKK